MSQQGAYPVLREDAVENENVGRREASSGAAVMVEPDIVITKSPKTIDHVDWKVSNGGRVTWRVTGIDADETLVIEIIEPAKDRNLFTLSTPSRNTVEATIQDPKGSGGTEKLEARYSVLLRKDDPSAPRTLLFGRPGQFRDPDPDPLLVIDSLGGPPGFEHPGHHDHPGQGRSSN